LVAFTTAGLRSTISRAEAPGRISYTRTIHADESGRPVLEQWCTRPTAPCRSAARTRLTRKRFAKPSPDQTCGSWQPGRPSSRAVCPLLVEPDMTAGTGQAEIDRLPVRANLVERPLRLSAMHPGGSRSGTVRVSHHPIRTRHELIDNLVGTTQLRLLRPRRERPSRRRAAKPGDKFAPSHRSSLLPLHGHPIPAKAAWERAFSSVGQDAVSTSAPIRTPPAAFGAWARLL